MYHLAFMLIAVGVSVAVVGAVLILLTSLAGGVGIVLLGVALLMAGAIIAFVLVNLDKRDSLVANRPVIQADDVDAENIIEHAWREQV